MKAIFTPLVIGTLIAAALNSVIFLVAAELFGEAFVVDPDGVGGEPSMAVPAMLPAVFTVFQAIVGGVIVAAIALATKTPKYTWRFVTLVGLSLSLVPTAFASLGVASTFLWLSGMHLVAGAIVIPLVERVLPAQKNGSTPNAESDSPTKKGSAEKGSATKDSAEKGSAEKGSATKGSAQQDSAKKAPGASAEGSPSNTSL